MAPDGRTQEISKTIEWSIADFFILAESKEYFTSPKFFIENFDTPYFLELYHRLTEDEEFMGIYLWRDTALQYEVECSFYLKKSDCSVIHLGNQILRKGKTFNDRSDLIKKTELLQKKSEFVPSNTLTLICTQFETRIIHAITAQKTVLKGTMPSKLSRLDKLSADFKNLFDDKESSDVTLKVQDKEYKADKSVLIARSNVFAATFKHDTLERQTGVITILDCDSDSFQDFLKYLYSGELEELSFRTTLNLYYTANKYDVEELKEFCIDCLKRSLTVETICETAVFAGKYDETQLLSEVHEFFNKNYKKILLNAEWKYLLENNFQLADKLLTEMAKSKE